MTLTLVSEIVFGPLQENEPVRMLVTELMRGPDDGGKAGGRMGRRGLGRMPEFRG
jgi:hypothetical protein